MRKKGSPGHTATADYMAEQSQRNNSNVPYYIEFGDEPQPALAPRGLTSSQLQVSRIALKVKILLNRHRVPIDLAIPSLRQHRTTPATDRDYPPPIGFLLHPAHLRFTFPIQSHVFKWQCRRNRPLLHITPINIL